MKLSYEWLKDYVDIDLTCEEVAEKLTMSGTEVEKIETSAADSVMDLEVTTNRPDCLSVLGLAREVSALTGLALKRPKSEVLEQDEFSFPCELKAPDSCPLYTVRAIKDIKVSPSPEAIKKRLEAVGLRSVNNIVDITNYCLMETGQPLHAFDMDKIKGGRLIVRGARKAEKIVTLDDVERELEEGTLVIADAEKAVAIAGVMGGKATEVTERTRNIVLESAYFDPSRIRSAVRKLGIGSDSSYRFERGVDKGSIRSSSDRAALLIAEHAGGTICSVSAAGDMCADPVEVKLRYRSLERYSGEKIPSDEADKALELLGMRISCREEGSAKISVPSFREDLRREADLIEEVMRVYGYDKISPEVRKFIPSPVRKDPSRRAADKIRHLLPALGLTEIVTYSLISDEEASLLGEDPRAVHLDNPISEDRRTLTPNLISGMFGALRHNVNRRNPDLALFEIGKSYLKEKKTYSEKMRLALAMTGRYADNWIKGKEQVTFYHIKGVLEELMARLQVECSFAPGEAESFEWTAEMFIGNGVPAGFIGKASGKLLDRYGLEQDVFYSEIELDRVINAAMLSGSYTPVPRFPSSVRDVSVLVDESVAGGEVLKVITSTGSELLKAANFVDIYRGEQIPEGKKSLTFSIEYGLCERTITEEEVEKAHSSVREKLKRELPVTFR